MTWGEDYQNGYKEGYLIGGLEALLKVTRRFMIKYQLDNYEACLRILQLDECSIARLMDYLPVSREKWRIPQQEEVDNLSERIKLSVQEEYRQFEEKKKRAKSKLSE